MSCLLVEPLDFSRLVVGGGGAAVIVSALRHRSGCIKAVGSTSSTHPIGQWTLLSTPFGQVEFLPVISEATLQATRLASLNLRFALAMLKCRGVLRSGGVHNVFTQTWSVLWAFALLKSAGETPWNVCYYFPGLGNAMLHGRKPAVGRYLARGYDLLHAQALGRADKILAAADVRAIDEYKLRLGRCARGLSIESVPTGVDMDVFRPMSRSISRAALGLHAHEFLFVYVGRLARVKGIPLLFSALAVLCRQGVDAGLVLVGDGEERRMLVELAQKEGIAENVLFVGLQSSANVQKYIACADACVCTSYTEGFSVAMIEQAACGRPIVTTEVSGASSVIIPGETGFIVPSRDPVAFAEKMLAAAKLKDVEATARQHVAAMFSESALWRRIGSLWPPLSGD